jgi:hypothetical protein
MATSAWYAKSSSTPITGCDIDEIMELTVRLATDEEKRELWPICDARLTRYAYYRKRSSRGMGIFACEGRTAI